MGLLTLLAILPFLCFADVLFEGKTFYVWDLSLTHFPQRAFAGEMLRQGKLALWNPYVLCGFPLLAEGQIGVLYPLSVLFALPIPSHLAFSLFIISHYSLAGAFTYLLARAFNLGRAASFISALAFSLSGYLMAQLVNLNIMTGSVWLPLILCFLRLAVLRESYGWAAAAGADLALQILTAQPQVVFYSALTLVAYSLFEGVSRWREGWGRSLRPLSLLAFALATGALLAAPQLLPTWELKQLSLRAEGLSYEMMTAFSLPPYRLLALLFPNFLGNPVAGYIGLPFFEEHHTYLGLLPLMMLPFAWRKRRELGVIFFSILAALAFLLALGGETPLYLALQYFPGFSLFRIPARWLLVLTLALSLLAGYGFESLEEVREKGRLRSAFRWVLYLSLALAVLSPALFIYKKAILRQINYWLAHVYSGISLHVVKALIKGLTAFPAVPQSNWLARAMPFMLNPLVFFWAFWLAGGLLVYLYLEGKLSRRWFQRLAGGILILDLFLSGGTTINAVEDSAYWQARPSTIFLQEHLGLHRIYPLEMGRYPPHALGHNFPTLYRIQSLEGSSSLNLQRHADFMAALRQKKRLLNLAGVRYILTEGHEPEMWPNRLRLVYHEEGLNIYENLDVLPRAFIVHRAEALPSGEAVLERLGESDFDPASVALLEGAQLIAPLPPFEETSAGQSDSEESVRIADYAPDRVIIEARANRPGLLFLSDTYYPGWQAYIDGKNVEIYRANYLFRAVPLSEGEHTVVFEFHPLSFCLGAWLSGLTLASLTALAVIFATKVKEN